MKRLFWNTVTDDTRLAVATLEKVSWQAMKEYFIKQAKEIEQSWLQ